MVANYDFKGLVMTLVFFVPRQISLAFGKLTLHTWAAASIRNLLRNLLKEEHSSKSQIHRMQSGNCATTLHKQREGSLLQFESSGTNSTLQILPAVDHVQLWHIQLQNRTL